MKTVSFRQFVSDYKHYGNSVETQVEEQEKGEVNQEVFDEFWETTEKECSEILDIYKKAKNFLYRGISAGEPLIRNIRIRQDRRPLEMPETYHNVINYASVKAGFPAHRGNSIFTSTDYKVSISWGNSYIVFPKNGFEYTWFVEQQELYMYTTWLYELEEIELRAGNEYKSWDKEMKDEFVDVFKSYAPRKTALDKCLMKRDAYDVLIKGNSYNACSSLMANKVKEKLK